MLSADELLAGSRLTFVVEVPTDVLQATNGEGAEAGGQAVKLRPLTISDLQLISRAAKESNSLIAVLMVQRALVEPEMTVAQVASMHAGLAQFLLQQVNQISGISTTSSQLSTAVEAPLAKAAFVLAKEFGWTPEQIGQLTLGQILLHLKMLRRE
jgi:hypothetical protein